MPYFSSYDGAALHYRVLGAEGTGRTRPPLLCLAGGPARDAAYLGDLGGLAAHHPLVVPDARGTGGAGGTGEPAEAPADNPGGSPAAADPAEYAFPRLAHDLEALRAHLGHDRFPLLAHDAAAATAQAYAAAHPDRLSHLLLLNPGSRLQGQLPSDARQILASRAAEDEEWWQDAYAAVQRLESATDLAEVRQLLLRAAPMAYARWRTPQRAHAATEGDQLNPVPRAGFWQGVDDTTRTAILEGLSKVDVPVLVITGALDAVTGVRPGEAVAASLPRARHHAIPDAGHYPWVDTPGSLVRLVVDFLRT